MILMTHSAFSFNRATGPGLAGDRRLGHAPFNEAPRDVGIVPQGAPNLDVVKLVYQWPFQGIFPQFNVQYVHFVWPT